jgi:hypothetical protein
MRKMSNIHKLKFVNGCKRLGNKRLGQYNLNENLIVIFENAIGVTKHTGLISNCMKQEIIHSEFIWRYI